MSGLPPGWEWTTLYDVASWGSGGTPKRTVPRYYGGDLPWAVIGDLNDGIVTDTAERITDEALANSSAKLVPQGAVLLAMYGSIGKLGIAGRAMATNQAIAFAQPHHGVLHTQYLFHYLYSQRQALASVGKGATQKNISQTVLRSWPIPLPPWREQERIVAAIEEHLSRLDAAEVSLRGARLRIGTLRAAVLAEWLTEQAGAHGLVPLVEKLGPGALFCDGDWVESKDQDPDGGIRLTQLADIGDGFWRDRSARFMRQEQFDRLGCTRLEPRDVLIARMPDPLGRACLFPGDPRPCVTVVDVAIVRPGADGPSPEWLVPVLNAAQTRRQVGALQAGTTRKRVSRRNLATVLVPDTPRHLQSDLVGVVEEAELVAQRVLDEIRQAEGRNAVLRRSVLAAAFSGQLVPQDADDEPASVLLERIRAERVSATPTKRTRRAKAS